MRMVELLPAPLGPTKPKICPDSKVNEMPFTARVVPKCLWRSLISMRIDRFQPGVRLASRRACPGGLDGGDKPRRSLHPSLRGRWRTNYSSAIRPSTYDGV